jgi:WD40 repeat protein
VYSTALLFSPPDSKIRQIFHPKIPVWIVLPPQADLNWTTCIRTLFPDISGKFAGLEFSPDLKLLALYSKFPDWLQVWQVNTGNCLHTFHGPHKYNELLTFPQAAIDLRFSPDSKLLYWALGDHIILLCVDTGLIVRKFKHRPCLPVVEAAPSSSYSDFDSEEDGQVWQSNSVASLSFSNCLRYLVSVSNHGVVSVWSTENWKLARRIEVSNNSGCKQVIFLDKPSRIAVGTDREITIWDLDADKMLHTLRLSGQLRCMKYSINSGLFFATGEMLQVFEPDTASIRRWPTTDATDSVELSLSDTMVTFNRYIKALDVWCLDTWHHLKRININSNHRPVSASMALSIDGKRLALCTDDGNVRIWQASDDEKRESQIHPVSCLRISPDSLMVASASPSPCNFTVTLWSTETGKRLNRIQFDAAGFNSGSKMYLEFSPDSRLLLVVYMSHIHIWEAKTGARVRTLEAPVGEFSCRAAFSCSSDLVAAICTQRPSFECFIQVWQVNTGRRVLALQSVQARNLFVSFVHNSTFLITSGTMAGLWLGDSATGQCVFETKDCFDGDLMMAAYANNSGLLAVAFEDYLVHRDYRWWIDIRRCDTPSCIKRVFVGEAPSCLRFGDNESRIFTSYSDLFRISFLHLLMAETSKARVSDVHVEPMLSISGLTVCWKKHFLFPLPSNTDSEMIKIRGPLVVFVSLQGHVTIMNLDLLKLDEMHKGTSRCQKPSPRCLYT